MSSELLTHALFTPLIGALFRADVDGRPVDLRLTEVTPLPSPRRRKESGEEIPAAELPARLEPFSMLFSGPPDRLLPQRIYRITQETLPAPLDIFIVPVARRPDSYVYEAVFG
jgi:hypothetical protein